MTTGHWKNISAPLEKESKTISRKYKMNNE